MLNHKWQLLQLFAEGATGGDGAGAAESGEGSADAGHQRLRELGVPEHLIRMNRTYSRPQQAPAAQAAPEVREETEQRDVAAETTEEKPTEEKPARMSWEEIKKDPEYNAEIQKIVQARLKEGNAAQANLKTLTPALELLARKHGQDPAKLDFEALAKAISDDDSYYEEKAMQMGLSVKTAKELDQAERQQARDQRQQALDLEQQKLQNHILKLEQQGQALKGTFPGFDLRTELNDPRFARLVSPGVGLSVDDAYYAVHRAEIQARLMQVAAQKTAQQISNAIQSGSRRPDESGVSAQAPSVTTLDYRNMSKAEREVLKNRIRSGEIVYPGR